MSDKDQIGSLTHTTPPYYKHAVVSSCAHTIPPLNRIESNFSPLFVFLSSPLLSLSNSADVTAAAPGRVGVQFQTKRPHVRAQARARARAHSQLVQSGTSTGIGTGMGTLDRAILDLVVLALVSVLHVCAGISQCPRRCLVKCSLLWGAHHHS